MSHWRRLEAYALGAELGVDSVQIVHHEGDVAVAGVVGVGVTTGPARLTVFEQLDMVARGASRAGQTQQRDAQLGVRVADDGAKVWLAAVPLGDQLKAEQIAVERDRSVQVADGEPGCAGFG